MPNIASILKAEIARLSRKALRSETQSLKKAVIGYRSEIAALRRRTQTLEQNARRLEKANGSHPDTSGGNPAPAGLVRFSAKGLASQRRRLGLSAHELGLLLGSSAQSIYNWEQGKARPRAKQLAAIAALKTLGKRQAAEIISSRSSAPPG